MRRGEFAGELLRTIHGQWRLMLAVVPGLAVTMLHSTALDLPRADLIDALDTDHYRVQWVFGSYVLGNAVGMGLTGYLGSRLGLRRAYLLAVLLFAAASGACAGVSDVFWMAPLRLLQGLGTGLLISTAMVLIWRAFPVHKELAMAVYGMAVFLPALAGAAVGGLLTAWISWRWVFLVNLPAGAFVGLAAWQLLPPDQPAEGESHPFDWFGLSLLAGFVVSLNVALDMGQYWGWLTSPTFVCWFVGLLIFSVAFVAWGIGADRPLINFRPLAQGHFSLGLGIKVLFSINLYVLVGLLSGYMINLRGYQWLQGSLVFLPGLAAMFLAVVAGTWLATNQNRKARMFLGLAAMALATWGLSVLDLYTARGWQAVHMAIWGAGAGLVCGPALLTTFEGLSTAQTLQTAGVFNIMRLAADLRRQRPPGNPAGPAHRRELRLAAPRCPPESPYRHRSPPPPGSAIHQLWKRPRRIRPASPRFAGPLGSRQCPRVCVSGPVSALGTGPRNWAYTGCGSAGAGCMTNCAAEMVWPHWLFISPATKNRTSRRPSRRYRGSCQPSVPALSFAPAGRTVQCIPGTSPRTASARLLLRPGGVRRRSNAPGYTWYIATWHAPPSAHEPLRLLLS